MTYLPNPDRYQGMEYRRCGNSGLKLPALSLGLWHNFGDITPMDQQQRLLRKAFDLGITHFDLANNYGPPYGAAEQNFGEHMRRDWHRFRDELVISSKAGYDMWPGPYGDHGSRKYLLSSLDNSLRKMNLSYVDIFYHHRPDPETPLEETMSALDSAVRQGKALYVGISNYPAQQAEEAFRILQALGTPCLIHQPSYSILNQWIEGGLTEALRRHQVGCIVFSPLQKGLLTGKYLKGIPADSRAAVDPRFLKPEDITAETQAMLAKLDAIAQRRGQSLAQMALLWTLRDPVVTSALIGASKPEQLEENVRALEGPAFTAEELREIAEVIQ